MWVLGVERSDEVASESGWIRCGNNGRLEVEIGQIDVDGEMIADSGALLRRFFIGILAQDENIRITSLTFRQIGSFEDAHFSQGVPFRITNPHNTNPPTPPLPSPHPLPLPPPSSPPTRP